MSEEKKARSSVGGKFSWKKKTLRRSLSDDSNGVLHQLLTNQPTFPGIPLHVCTIDATPDQVERIGVQYPVHIHNVVSRSSSNTDPKRNLSQKQGWVKGTKNNAMEKNAAVCLKGMTPVATSGSHEFQGERTYMEDRTIRIDDNEMVALFPTLEERMPLSYYAIYDGHGGSHTVEICAKKLHVKILCELESTFDEDVGNLLQACVSSLDQKIIAKGLGEGWTDGACISLAILNDNILYTANLGDSLIVLGRRKMSKTSTSWSNYSSIEYSSESLAVEALSLAATHKPTEADEKQRITSLGGMVLRGRVFGDLAVSRAMGDLNYKKPKQEENFVSSELHFTRTVLSSDLDEFLIIASDGLWDKVSPQEAVEFIQKLKLQGKSACESAQELSELAKSRFSTDNTSVLVVHFSWILRDQSKTSFKRKHKVTPNSTQPDEENGTQSSDSDNGKDKEEVVNEYKEEIRKKNEEDEDKKIEVVVEEDVVWKIEEEHKEKTDEL